MNRLKNFSTGCSLLMLLLLCASLPAEGQRRKSKAKPKSTKSTKQTSSKQTSKKQTQQKSTKPVTRLQRDDTTIRSATLEVIQQYEPELKPVTKAELNPDLPPPPSSRAPQEYQVPQQTMYYSYRALPLRPLALGTADTAPEAPMNYALLGIGNLSTVLGEIGIGSFKGKDWATGLQARYITQQGDPNDQVYRSFDLNADGWIRRMNHTFEAGLKAEHDVYGAYGYDHKMLEYDFEDVRRALSGGAIHLGASNDRPGPWGVDYHPTFDFSYYTASTWSNEQSLRINLPAEKQLDSNLRVGLAVDARMTRSDYGPNDWMNNVIQFRPFMAFEYTRFGFKAGLYPTIGTDYSFLLLPDLEAHYRFKEHVHFSAGWKADVKQNTLRELTIENPWYNPGGRRAQTRQDEFFGGLSFALGRHLNFFGGIAYKKWENQPLFITVPNSDGKDFDLLIDPKITALCWNVGMRYAIGEDLILGAEAKWQQFIDYSYAHVWGMPGVRVRGNADWKVINNLKLGAYVSVIDQIWCQDLHGQEVKLKGVLEFGASAEYTLIRRLDLFLRAENIANRANERWLGYPSLGFNIYGGARYRF